eukprot:7020232-Prymnesium_polylepis.1
MGESEPTSPSSSAARTWKEAEQTYAAMFPDPQLLIRDVVHDGTRQAIDSHQISKEVRRTGSKQEPTPTCSLLLGHPHPPPFVWSQTFGSKQTKNGPVPAIRDFISKWECILQSEEFLAK